MTLHDFKDRNDFGSYLMSNGLLGTGVEVGVYMGEFSEQLLSHWNGRLIGVDSYNHGTDFHLLCSAIWRNAPNVVMERYKILVCDSLTATRFTPSELDFAFLDGDHSYDAVKLDISEWYPKIRVGGILCGHDLEPREPGVSKAVNEFMAAHPNLELVTKPCGSWFVEKKI